MAKNFLEKDQKMSAAYVDRAVVLCQELVTREARGPGDLPNAMRRIERHYGIPFWAQWSLRYKRPKKIDAGLFERIRRAAEVDERLRGAGAYRAQTTLGASLLLGASALRGGAAACDRVAARLDHEDDWPVIPG